jgi:hypothetical protein
MDVKLDKSPEDMAVGTDPIPIDELAIPICRLLAFGLIVVGIIRGAKGLMEFVPNDRPLDVIMEEEARTFCLYLTLRAVGPSAIAVPSMRTL